jgi:DNA-binding response OmpR family regulator
MHIVVLESGSEAMVAVQRSCRRAGHIVSAMEATPEGLDHLCDAAFDLLILDASTLRGLARPFAALRGRQPCLAVIAIGARGEIAATCLDNGADLVLPDEADRDLLLAGACAVVRRARGFASSQVAAGPLSLDLDRRCCTLNGRAVALSDTEYRLLEALMLRSGTVVTRPMLLELLYEPGSEPQARTIDLFVHRLRWKLAAPRTPSLIETRRNGFAITVALSGVQPLAA